MRSPTSKEDYGASVRILKRLHPVLIAFQATIDEGSVSRHAGLAPLQLNPCFSPGVPRAGVPCYPSGVDMRPLGPFALAALVCVAADLDAAPPRPRHPGPAPAPASTEGSTRDGVVLLRAPGPEQILLRAGTFTMGSDDADFAEAMSLYPGWSRAGTDCKEVWFTAEQPAHQVYLSDYWIDRTEVTVARYRQCVASHGAAAPPYAEGGERFDRPELPVSLVTWNDARHFCDVGRRPPAHRGRVGARRPRPRPQGPGPARPREQRRAPQGPPLPVGQRLQPLPREPRRLGHRRPRRARRLPPELAPLGLLARTDGRPRASRTLAGSMQVAVADWFAPEYPAADAVNPKGPDMGDRRVVRGGSYMHGPAWLRSAARDKESPGERTPWIGFRCARDGAPRLSPD